MLSNLQTARCVGGTNVPFHSRIEVPLAYRTRIGTDVPKPFLFEHTRPMMDRMGTNVPFSPALGWASQVGLPTGVTKKKVIER